MRLRQGTCFLSLACYLDSSPCVQGCLCQQHGSKSWRFESSHAQQVKWWDTPSKRHDLHSFKTLSATIVLDSSIDIVPLQEIYKKLVLKDQSVLKTNVFRHCACW